MTAMGHERRHLLSNAQRDTAVTAVKPLKTVWAGIIIETFHYEACIINTMKLKMLGFYQT